MISSSSSSIASCNSFVLHFTSVYLILKIFYYFVFCFIFKRLLIRNSPDLILRSTHELYAFAVLIRLLITYFTNLNQFTPHILNSAVYCLQHHRRPDQQVPASQDPL